MSLYDAAVVQEVVRAIDATLAAITPGGVNPNAINRAYPALVNASVKARDLYARIVEEHPIVAIEIDETESDTLNEPHKEKERDEAA